MNCPSWLALNDEALVPVFGARSAPNLGPVAALVSTEPDLRAVRTLCGTPIQSPFFMGTLFCLDQGGQGAAVAGPYIGAPYGAMVLESIIAKGADTILVLGWCGALSEHLKTGDILVPDLCLADEGTSRNYMEADGMFPRVSPSGSLSSVLRGFLTSHNVPHGSGTVWTTDAIYRETRTKVNYFKAIGASAVDMECSALCAVARYRKVRIAALLVVSDELYGSGWNPGFRNERFRTARKTAAGILVDLCRTLASEMSIGKPDQDALRRTPSP
ncbi:MAG: nucleoside phosphorylase [Pseudomonadota bacterium]